VAIFLGEWVEGGLYQAGVEGGFKQSGNIAFVGETPVGPSSGAGRFTFLVGWFFVRGLVMVLMVIDHVRVYSGQPAGGPTARASSSRAG
jgi:hypothetical protein